jgi:hypothetical protein
VGRGERALGGEIPFDRNEYLGEFARTNEGLDGRCDGLKSGRAKPIDGEEALARLKAKTEARGHGGE